MNNVRLVAVTQPTIKKENHLELLMSPDEFVAYCARVSNPANQMNSETADKLMKYLIRNQHWSPFEMVHMTMEIITTRDIGRQILRHRSFAFQEFSQRYGKVTVFTKREARLQDNKNRQNSIETNDEHLQEEWYDKQVEICDLVAKYYSWALENGIAKEQARVILPEGLTMSTMYMSGSVRSWIHYCQLRCGNGTQKEHREIAEQCRNILVEHFASTSVAF